MKSYKVKNLERELKKRKNVALSMKRSIDNHEGPAWAKNQLIQRYNKEVRVIKMVKDSLLDAIVKS